MPIAQIANARGAAHEVGVVLLFWQISSTWTPTTTGQHLSSVFRSGECGGLSVEERIPTHSAPERAHALTLREPGTDR
jgi:hypothetical protein